MSATLYLWLNLLTLAGPLARSFEPRVNFRSRWFASLPSLVIVAILFIGWDAVFTRIGVWGFNPQYLVGVSALGLPMEEWMFFVTVPYACVFSYDCLNYFFPGQWRGQWPRWTALALAVITAFLALVFNDRLYTATTCALSALCMFIAWWKDPPYLGRFLRAYAVALIPFFLVNGVLTGGVTDAPVVWYNDAENLGFRLGTIPVEDAFYLLVLLWLNIAQYEWRLDLKSATALQPE